MLQTITTAMKRQTGRYSFQTGLSLQTLNTVALVLGNLVFIVGIYAARSVPASGYEVDIYRATPLLFWGSVAFALVAALWVLTHPSDRLSWAAALTLAAVAGLSIPAVPLLRGYFFYGLTDALHHLGWARELLAGATTFFGDLYPATHVFSAVIAVLSGASIERSMLLVVLLLISGYVVFTTLVVREILPGRTATVVAVFVGLLFLPINHVAFGPHFHTYSLATFFFPFLLYLVVKHVTATRPDPTLPGRLSATDLGFLFAGATIVVLHPQVAANVVVLLGTFAVVQFVARWRAPDSRFGRSKPVYGQFVFLSAVFLAWNVQYDALFGLSTSLADSLVGVATGTGQESPQLIADRAASAEGAGTSVTALFGKIFLLKLVFVAIAGTVVARDVVGYLKSRGRATAARSDGGDGSALGDRLALEAGRSPEVGRSLGVDIVVGLLTVSGLALAVFFAAHYLGGVQGYFFRHVGFGMVLVSFLAVVGIVRFIEASRHTSPTRRRALRSTAFALTVAVLVVSMAAFFASPYISLPSNHVSEQQYAGHATTFEYGVDNAAYAALRTGPERYYDARGANLDNRLSWGIGPEDMGASLRDVRDHDYPQEDFYYLFMTETDRQKELVAYNGLRFSADDFETVSHQEGVSRVVTNGEVDAYQVLYSTVEDDGPGE
ncbi:hypothetical protein SAMN04487949_2264 [Halogranum gelatinilyticum]|uniref:Dolichyl-phosphate-mannose-protein mannosyltransferase n=1 Tax=Halogranum gelatinilyticum TaxID=660521 RepID=A0A1G9UNB8_9EURY|nr:hypothetical protein [Halogranum gelatinilyticum]SDM61452.1 hypothetical protein SAMN04487949_2264 [Halogranum gelatinilyticum]